MDPSRAVIRGVKISASNPGLAIVGWAVGLATALLLIVPLVLLAAGAAFWMAQYVDTEAIGTGALLASAVILLDHWPLTLGVLLITVIWAGIILFAYLYAQGGIYGCAVLSHRRGAAGDRTLKPKLGAAPSFAVFSGRTFWEQVKAQGGRVTAVATAYSAVATVPLLLDGAWTWWCIREAMGGGAAALVLGISGAVVGILLLALVFMVLAIHYRFALTCAVLRCCGWVEAVGAANNAFRSRPMEALAVVGFTIGARYALGLVSFVVSVPLALFSLVPFVGLLLLMPRLLLSVMTGLISSAITVASLGAIAAVCEPAGEDGAGERESRGTGENTEGRSSKGPQVSQDAPGIPTP